MNKIILLIIVITTTACSNRELRGKTENSSDKKTYLIVEDNQGGKCGDIYVDGKIWNYKIGQAGQIEPGVHKIACVDNPHEAKEMSISFNIPNETIFKFDYWGP